MGFDPGMETGGPFCMKLGRGGIPGIGGILHKELINNHITESLHSHSQIPIPIWIINRFFFLKVKPNIDFHSVKFSTTTLSPCQNSTSVISDKWWNKWLVLFIYVTRVTQRRWMYIQFIQNDITSVIEAIILLMTVNIRYRCETLCLTK